MKFLIWLHAMKFNLGMLISSATVSISAYFPTLVMTILLQELVLAGTYLYYRIAPQLDEPKAAAELKQVG
ncbi:hypothetical protein RZN22_16630 [Bacillaceae bacterium S4-13-58]